MAVPQNPYGPQTGLLGLLGAGSNPLYRSLKDGGLLDSIAYGLSSGKNLSDGLSKAAIAQIGGRNDREERAIKAAEWDKANQQQNATRALLDKEAPDLAQLLDTGIPMGEVWGEYLRRKSPQSAGEAFTLGEGQVRYAPDGTIIATGAPKLPDQKDAFNMESDLSKQYLGTDPVKTYQAVRNGYERVRASAKTDSGPGDVSMIFAYMKMLDPTSVVREGEFATAENAGGVGAQVQNLYNKILTGERLTPELRKQFLKAADNLYSEVSTNLSDVNKQFSTRAGAWNVDPTRFVLSPEAYEPLGATDPLGIR